MSATPAGDRQRPGDLARAEQQHLGAEGGAAAGRPGPGRARRPFAAVSLRLYSRASVGEAARRARSGGRGGRPAPRSRPRRARRRAARSRRASASRWGVSRRRSRARRRGRPRSGWRGRGSARRPPRATAGPTRRSRPWSAGRCRGRSSTRSTSSIVRPRLVANSSSPASIAPSGSSISRSLAAWTLTRSSVSCCTASLLQVAVGAERVEQLDALLDVVVGDHAVVDGQRRREGVRGQAPGRRARHGQTASDFSAIHASSFLRGAVQVPRAMQTRAGQSALPLRADARQPQAEADRGRGRQIIR